MKTLIACYGLPASGKSTWALEHCLHHPEFVRVSKDDIRAEARLMGWTWSYVAEKRDIIPERDRRIREALKAGFSAISDDTNLAKGHLNALAMIASMTGAAFEIHRFEVPLEECLRRDAARPDPVGEPAIRRMAAMLDQQYQSSYAS